MRVAHLVRSVFLTVLISSASFAQKVDIASLPKRAIVHSDSIGFGAVSVSPDGKWLAFDGAIRGRSSIWIAAASGGELHRITDGLHDDFNPVWFPSGDRLAFAGNRVRGAMSVAIDPARGTAAGPLKRISLEPTAELAISPDGRQIAYIVEPNADGKARIRIAPANGGVAKTIYAAEKRLVNLRFSSDGQTVFFTTWRMAPTVERSVERVSVNGGAATTLPRSQGEMVMAYPGNDRMTFATMAGITVRTMAGDSITTVPVVKSIIFKDFSSDGRVLYQSTSETAATIRLVSTTGKPTIDITPPSSPGYFYPLSWSTDNRLFYNDEDRTDSVFAAVVGSQRREAYSLAPVNPLDGWKPTSAIDVSGDGRFVIMAVAHPGGRSIFRLELATKKLTEIAENVVDGAMLTAYWKHRDAFYFFENVGTSRQLKSVSNGEPPRVIGTVPSDTSLRLAAVIGDRALYRKQVGDSTLIVSVGMSGASTRVATLPGAASALFPSPDGRWLASTVSAGASAGGEQRVVFLPLGADGKPSGSPTFVKTDNMWDLTWTPDNRAVIGLEEEGQSDRTRIRRVPVDPKEPSTVLGPSGTTFWDTYLSPDGKYVAIPMEHTRGSTLWAFDLPATPITKR